MKGKCNIYKKKDSMVVEEGKVLQIIMGYTEDECKTRCSDLEGCYSFRYCPAALGSQTCFFRDKKISEHAPEKPKNGCYTVYQDCENGIYQDVKMFVIL